MASDVSDPTVSTLVATVSSDSSGAARDIGRIGRPVVEAVPTLLAALGNAEWNIRAAAAEGLGGIGVGTVRALISARNDADGIVREAAEEAISRIRAAIRAAEQDQQQAVRERAYFLWEREGCPEGRALDHWHQALTEEPGTEDEEKVLADRTDANIPEMLTKDVPGG
jgi:hypothetical protein